MIRHDMRLESAPGLTGKDAPDNQNSSSGSEKAQAIDVGSTCECYEAGVLVAPARLEALRTERNSCIELTAS